RGGGDALLHELPAGALGAHPDEQPLGAAEPGDPAPDAGGGDVPGRGVGADAGGGAAALRGGDGGGGGGLPERGQGGGSGGGGGGRGGGGMRPGGGSAPATSYRRTGTASRLREGLPRRKVRKILDATLAGALSLAGLRPCGRGGRGMGCPAGHGVFVEQA